mmetsp:Transcript_19933/g.46789  ORF Transcript_19933/g.46789 Transcript_19933/m.46789 type:complete len:315 (+) Transcript_19933:1346-2290(+)
MSALPRAGCSEPSVGGTRVSSSRWKPISSSDPDMRSESAAFIWQPIVIISYVSGRSGTSRRRLSQASTSGVRSEPAPRSRVRASVDARKRIVTSSTRSTCTPRSDGASSTSPGLCAKASACASAGRIMSAYSERPSRFTQPIAPPLPRVASQADAPAASSAKSAPSRNRCRSSSAISGVETRMCESHIADTSSWLTSRFASTVCPRPVGVATPGASCRTRAGSPQRNWRCCWPLCSVCAAIMCTPAPCTRTAVRGAPTRRAVLTPNAATNSANMSMTSLVARQCAGLTRSGWRAPTEARDCLAHVVTTALAVGE